MVAHAVQRIAGGTTVTIGLWHEAGTYIKFYFLRWKVYKYSSLAFLLSLGKLVSCFFSKQVSRWERIFTSLNLSWAISLAGLCESQLQSLQVSTVAGRLGGQNTRMRTVSASPGGRNPLADSARADIIS